MTEELLPGEVFSQLENNIKQNIEGKSFEPVHQRDSMIFVKGKCFNVLNDHQIFGDLYKIIENYYLNSQDSQKKRILCIMTL